MLIPKNYIITISPDTCHVPMYSSLKMSPQRMEIENSIFPILSQKKLKSIIILQDLIF
jgi:hypothetical protein